MIHSNTAEFLKYVEDNKNKYEWGFIYGNAPTLNLISDAFVNDIKTEKVFTIGLNRSHKRMTSDVLLFTDQAMRDEIEKNPPYNVNKLLYVSRNENLNDLRIWADMKTINEASSDNLVIFRNSLIGALHLCNRLNIKNIVMFGIQMDDRRYFYGQHPKGYKEDVPYDESELLGYNTHKIVQEVLQYKFSKEHNIYFVGESKFLSGLGCIKPMSLEKLKEKIL